MRDSVPRTSAFCSALAGFFIALFVLDRAAAGGEPPWVSPCRHRAVLRIDPVRGNRSESPVRVALDRRILLGAGHEGAHIAEKTVEVIAYDDWGIPAVYDESRRGYERYLLPRRVDSDYGASRFSLAFVLPSESTTTVVVYWETRESANPRSPPRYAGLVGDGDFLREGFARREIGATHFDTFADIDGDGDLDLVRGGVEPFLWVYENTGDERLEPRGRLCSGGDVLVLPRNAANNRSWVVPHFYDLDGDGDLDLLPSFTDGPYGGRIVFFENTSETKAELVFADRGVLATKSGTPIAGGAQAGGWFPSLAFVPGTGAGSEPTLDLVLGSNQHAYFYASTGRDDSGRWQWSDAETLTSEGSPIELFNPCFETADVDGDGDWDLFAAPQSGEIILYRNLGIDGGGADDATQVEGAARPRRAPKFSRGVVIAYDERYLQRSTHPRVTAGDFTGDGLVDFIVDRAWELANLDSDLAASKRDYGALFENVGTAEKPRWERRGAGAGAFYTEEFQPCDALRQNVVRAADWNGDGRLDVLAGDCDGFIGYFENVASGRRPIFAAPRRLETGAGRVLSLADRGGHARPDVADWNEDGIPDLVVADGAGGITLFLAHARGPEPELSPGVRVTMTGSDGIERPIELGTRAHVLVCDWNHDGRKDLVASDQDSKSFQVFLNEGEDAAPRFGDPHAIPTRSFVRPNLGCFVDWDGDGREDLVACEFEHSIRLFRDVGSGARGEEPVLADRDGRVLVQPFSIMLISGADAVDWNGDGDLDLLTGQGHGGSGIRFYERDFIDDTEAGTFPSAELVRVENASDSLPSFLEVVKRYADAMLEHGRDVYGEVKSGLFLSALDRIDLRPLESRPAAPGGIRRGDRDGLPWRRLAGANPHHDENLLRVLYTLSELTGEERYREAADHEIEWFFHHAPSPVTGLLPWGEHLSWDVLLDRPASSGTDLTHEFARPWVLWDRTFALAPEAAARFAHGLWEHQIADHRSGGFDRHAPYDRHGPTDGKDFPRHAGFYIRTWAQAFKHTGDEAFLDAIGVLVARYERKRTEGGEAHSTLGPLDLVAAAELVPRPLSERMREFALEEDRLILGELRARFGDAGGGWQFPVEWEAGYATGTNVDWALFACERWKETGNTAFLDLLVAIARAYLDARPAEDADVWPMTFGHVISTEVAAYRETGEPLYLAEALRLARLAVELFFAESALPRASLKTGHYETITGGDTLALALLDLHAAWTRSPIDIPWNTIDR